ncbi:murein biosynthesis integral membrane protein MurJ [Candidatus Pelagibacter sp. HIMB1321]|uniref:murein biosynthesis integral membrane protein MurJ n=1 Tax=Candidatus Pelagibacter sp. HIMB1321 TaxID=1388755 RepID=UPI000A07F406|nr:murein biosynthesis integral membrane protein MurJ [Candidatus Pelagibacter sp. HIMB1321]SMF80466.1 putative peptidoglycan lipid II flippase [Candidatus Pelagibacter sp. HIMB1321]
MNLIKSTGAFSFFTIISRIFGYLRDILIAIFLGTSFLADAFFVAFRIPNTFRRLFAEGTFNAAFVPSYSSEVLKGKAKSNKFASEVFNLLFLILLILVLLVQIFMPVFVSLIAPGFLEDSEKMQLAINLTRITFPFLLLISLASFFSGILNSYNRFAEAAAAPIILNLILIIVLLFSKSLNDDLVYYLSYAVTLAGLLQFIFLYFFVRKFFNLNFNLSFKVSKNVKIFFKKLVPSIFSSGVTQINILVGTIIASFQASAVSYLYYADRIYQINLAIAGIAIGVVILPQLSKHIIKKNKKKIDLIQNKALELSLFLSLPATIALLLGSDNIISALFGYGQFNESSVLNSANALFYFALGLPAFAFIKVFSNFFFANHDTKTPFYISLASVLLNILISVYFFRLIGFIIIPIATSISSWFNTIILFLILKKRNLFNFNSIFINRFFKIILSSVLMGALFYYLLILFQYELAFDQTFKSFYLILSVVIALCFYIFVSYLMKAFQLEDIKLKY